MAVRFIVRESHLLKHQASALADAIAAAAADAASANEVACYNLVQFAQSWLEQMQSPDASIPILSHAAAPAAAPSVSASDSVVQPAADASDSLVGNSSIAILLDLWKQGQEIHSQYMVRPLTPALTPPSPPLPSPPPLFTYMHPIVHAFHLIPSSFINRWSCTTCRCGILAVAA